MKCLTMIPDVCASVTCPVLTTPALRPGEYVEEGSTEDGCCKTVTVKCLPARCPAVGETECEAPKVARPRRLSQCCFDIECGEFGFDIFRCFGIRFE